MKKNCLVILSTFFFHFSTLSNAYNVTSQCYQCLTQTSPSSKYCLPYEDSSTGYCCQTSSTADQCSSNSRYVCSDLVQSQSMKLFLCPNQATKCFSTSLLQSYDQNIASRVIYVSDYSEQAGGTTLDFGNLDICGWHIIGDNQFVKDKFLRITIGTVNNVKCYLNSGTSILSASGETSCVANTNYDFNADQHVFITVQGQSASGAYLQFSYKLVDRIQISAIASMYSVSVFLYVLLTGTMLVLVSRFCAQKIVRDNQEHWK